YGWRCQEPSHEWFAKALRSFRAWYLVSSIEAFQLTHVVAECPGTCKYFFFQPSHRGRPWESLSEKHSAVESIRCLLHQKVFLTIPPSFFFCKGQGHSKSNPER